MKKATLLLFFISYIHLHSTAQVGVQWQFLADTPENSSLILTDANNNVYTFGQYGGIRKYNHLGDTILFISDTAYTYIPVMAKFDHDEKLVVVGSYSISPSERRLIIQKIDTSGNKLWATSIDATFGDREYISAFDFDIDNNIYFTGYNGQQFRGRIYTAKVSPSGNLIWENSYIGPYEFSEYSGQDIAVFDSSNIYVVGYEYESGGSLTDTRLIKYDHLGNQIWSTYFDYHDIYGGQWNTNDKGKEIAVDDSGNVYIVSENVDDRFNVILKYDPAGNQIWRKRVHTFAAKYDEIIIESSELYIGGYTDQVGTKIPFGTKLDLNGNVIYNTAYTSGGIVFGVKLQGNSLIIAATAYGCNGCDANIVTFRLNAAGNIDWFHNMTTDNNYLSDIGAGLAIDNYDGIYVTGSGYGSNYWMNTYKLFNCENINPQFNSVSGTLVANYIPGAEYIWRDCDSNYIVAQGIELVAFTPLYPANYTLEISTGFCSDTTECDSLTSRINSFESSKFFTVFPNPATEFLTIQYPEVYSEIYHLYNSTGKKIKEGFINNSSDEINISSLQPGLYLLKIGRSSTIKIQKY